jgi:hypothetical protein
MQEHHGTSTPATPMSTGGTHLLETLVLFSSGTSELLGEQLILNLMTYQNFNNPYPFHSGINVLIPDELKCYLSEAAEDLEITADELVPQAISSYCRDQQGRKS